MQPTLELPLMQFRMGISLLLGHQIKSALTFKEEAASCRTSIISLMAISIMKNCIESL